MGIYLNPGKERFQEAINSQIFVDKTEMIPYLNSVINTKQKYLSISRPRRFGKTMAADMICAYYDKDANSQSMFEKTKLANHKDWGAYLGKFNVIRIVMTDFFNEKKTVSQSLEKMKYRILWDLEEAYPNVKYDEDDFNFSMERFYRSTGIQFVIVIDEWDALFRIKKEDKKGQREYLDFLRNWLKDQAYVAMAYITGILPIKKYGQHSALNMFDEYSMIAPMQLAKYTGFTETEVKELCEEYKMNYEDIKDWYDGYLISDQISIDKREAFQRGEYKGNIYSIYSPLSVVNAMRTGYIRNYWNNTESYEALAEYIRKDFDGLKDTVALLMDGGRSKVNLSTYQNDMTTFNNKDDILALLIHLGYLGYDEEHKEVFIPNKEILDVFKASTMSKEWEDTFKMYEESQKLLKATWNQEEDKVAELLEKAHNSASNKTYNNESALSYSIQLAYYAAEKYYTKIVELDSGKGYVDIVYIPSLDYHDKPVLLIELKYNKDVNSALEQIKRQKYPERLEKYKGNILLVSINYDKDVSNKKEEFKHHTCKIVKA